MAVVAASSLLAACGDHTEPEAVELEVHNWWQQQSEQRAFLAVEAIHENNHPNVDILIRQTPNAISARDIIAGQLLLGVPYSTFQANVGADLLRWAMTEKTNSPGTFTSYLHPIDDLFEKLHLDETLWPALLPGLRVGREQRYYAVPINIHRLNLIYYNVDRVQDWSEANGGDDLFTQGVLCPDPSAPRELNLKIAIGREGNFERTLLVFENLLPALTSANFYEELFRGAPPAGWESEVRRVLACYQSLARYFVRPSTTPATWLAAARDVADPNGDAHFTIMGDWLNGELKSELRVGTVAATPFPGSEDIFVFTSDTFPLPVQARHRSEIKALLETIADPATQQAFSAEKGSIPALKDAPLPENDPEAERTYREFARDTAKVFATSGWNPLGYPQGLLEGLLVDLEAQDAMAIDRIIDLLVDAQPLLEHWNQVSAEETPSPVAP